MNKLQKYLDSVVESTVHMFEIGDTISPEDRNFVTRVIKNTINRAYIQGQIDLLQEQSDKIKKESYG